MHRNYLLCWLTVSLFVLFHFWNLSDFLKQEVSVHKTNLCGVRNHWKDPRQKLSKRYYSLGFKSQTETRNYSSVEINFIARRFVLMWFMEGFWIRPSAQPGVTAGLHTGDEAESHHGQWCCITLPWIHTSCLVASEIIMVAITRFKCRSVSWC